MLQRLRIIIKGVVQGVGFRPFVFKLAKGMGIHGWIINSSQGVFIEVEQGSQCLKAFLLKLEKEKPVHSHIQSLEATYLDPVGFEGFEIRESQEDGEKTVLVLPDIATCPECLEELFDPENRRYHYPFTNCTLCGPRYSIIKALPYDRPSTSMKGFPMCPECLREYKDPENRRFHAQPNACPKCGPKVQAFDQKGRLLSENGEAISFISDQLKKGKIVAVKGLGGFHLMVNASDADAIKELRFRKKRNEKPFAILSPSLEKTKGFCEIDEIEQRVLCSSEAPIVLLKRKKEKCCSFVSDEAAPGNPTLGVMLPYTPLHHLLLSSVQSPLVATSGNLSDEPICIDNEDALSRLGTIADYFLCHNRPIVRPVDDSVVRVMAGRELVIRRARGFAPLPVSTRAKPSQTMLAVGAHQKNSIALQIGSNAIISQHIGDLETEQSYASFEETIESLKDLYQVSPDQVICDLHPEYLSSKYARSQKGKLTMIQHHHAHIASCMAENQLRGDVLGVSWDGTGAGLDDSIWGGEFLLGNEQSMERFSSFREFRLPGSSQAAREPRRSAMGVLYKIYGESFSEQKEISTLGSFDETELKLLSQMLSANFNSPNTSSVGRLFDAVASITGVRHISSYEGQAAMELEFLIKEIPCNSYYEFGFCSQIDWEPLIIQIIEDMEKRLSLSEISAKFHNTLAEIIVSVAKTSGEKRVVLSGGCFQNRYLTERTISRLQETGFKPYWHQRVPPNDGGIALGQLYSQT